MIRRLPLALLAVAAMPLVARADPAPPPAVLQADLDEQLGRVLPRDLVFTDSSGARLRLGDLFGDGRPVVLILAYYHCPMLCTLVMDGVAKDIRAIDLALGAQYRVVTVSFDPDDGIQDAFRKQAEILGRMGRPDAVRDWRFLVGDASAIHALTDAVGFRYAYDARTRQFAHVAAVVVLTPEGRISRYLYGVDYPAKDFRLALLEAGQGRIGSIVDRVLLTCYHYDPSTRRYGIYVMGVLRLGGLLVFLVLGGLIGTLWLRDRRRTRRAAEPRAGAAQ